MSHSLAADDLLIDLIYSAMLGESSWQDFLSQVSSGSPGSCSVLFSYDKARSEGLIGLYSGVDETTVDDFEGYYSALNPLAPYCAIRQAGIGLIAHDIYPQELLLKSEYYNDFMVRIGLRSAVGCTIDKGDDRSVVLSLVTVEDDPDLIQPLADQLTRIAPHLKRAADFYRKGPKLRAVSELGGSLFDAVHIGMVMIGEGGRVKAVSQAAERQLGATPLIRVSAAGRVSLRSESAQRALADMLRRDYRGPKSVSFWSEATKVTLIHIEKDRLSFYFEGPTVILLLEEARSAGPDGFDRPRFARDHGLSAAEERALSGIVSGRSVDEIAEAASLSRETIRSQIKSLYAKAGVNREADLLRLVFTRYGTA